MFTIPAILAALKFAVANMPTFIALGVNFVDMFDKSKALISSDTASTPAERAAAMTEIEGLEAQRDARLEELRLTAPNS